MSKKHAAASRKRTLKSLKKRASRVADPEWEFVEERFSSMGMDFMALAQKLGDSQGL